VPVSAADGSPEKGPEREKLRLKTFPLSSTARTIGSGGGAVPTRSARKEEARDGSHRRGPDEVQLRLASTLTFEQYVTTRAWEQATLDACPLCAPGKCRLEPLAPYMRKVPVVAFVARFYCRVQHTTFSLLPDFYASRVPGTLDDIERAAVAAEAGGGTERTANTLRPADVPDAVTLDAAVEWVSRRTAWARALLALVGSMLPERFVGVERSVRAFREHLRTSSVLVALRGICERHLHALPRPLGLNPRTSIALPRDRASRQSMGPDPPAENR
jgi:hypothetical protein